MKRMVFTAVLFMAMAAGPGTVLANGEEPIVYEIKKGDTLWGLSDRFIKDPYYWPDLWANNPRITNPHFIFPGQKVKIYPDRIVIEEATPLAPATAGAAGQPPAPPAPPAAQVLVEEVAQQKTFTVRRGAGFLLENESKPSGHIIATNQNRVMVGEDDVVYTDIGRKQRAKVGDRFSIYRDMGTISHPVTNFILGRKIIPLGTLQLSEVDEDGSKAIVTKSFMEISAGSYLMPYRERRKEVALQAASRDLNGYVVDSQSGTQAVAVGDVVFIDLGTSQGVAVGNMLYVVRDVVPDQQYVYGTVKKLPVEVLGALVVVETGEKTATGLIVKSIDTIYPGDRVELRKSR